MEFLTGQKLADQIYDTIYDSEKYLLVVSPFIQLDSYFKNEVFKHLATNAQVHVMVAFGKNENNVGKSFRRKDIEFFTNFPNVTIVYIPKLHAKYYGNEKKAIVTSMNLIDYSFLNNIEFGVITEKKLIGSNKFFDSSQSTVFNIIENEGFTIYVKRPKYKKKFLIGKDYVGSEVELDKIDDIIHNENIDRIKFSDFISESYVDMALKEERLEREEVKEVVPKNEKKVYSTYRSMVGNCIRCNDSIELDPDRPYCLSCFRTWAQYEDPYYSENYCHECGKKHSTSMHKPTCYPCYSD